jgi:hypothetical protein
MVLQQYPKTYPFLPPHSVQREGRSTFEVTWEDGTRELVHIDSLWVVSDEFYANHKEAVKIYPIVSPNMWKNKAWLAVAINITNCYIDLEETTLSKLNERRILESISEHL